MAAGAADRLFRYVYEGCLSGGDMGIERRPYHRNCGCALHKIKENCPHTVATCKNVSYRMKKSWSEGCLALAASCHSSPSSSPSLRSLDQIPEGGTNWEFLPMKRKSKHPV
uniref:Uncharacterized protein n=1 Tax=Rhizophora mucronata TaxID=61149 RepID=A0A2P2Q7D8_RHIMU